jgi:TonB-linked SusC/RagA family outer membrane protein
MKVAVLLMVILLQARLGISQGQTISLSEKNATLEDLFEKIQTQTNYNFLVDAKTLATAKPVDINVKDATLEQVLQICFKDQPLKYTISGNAVVVKPLDKVESKIPEKTTGLHYVEGRVVDKSGGAIPGTNVVIRGTSEGTVTDAEGKYSIQVNESDLLSFSFIGFKRFETEVGERTIIDVTLEEEISALKEVTINGGYYETTDELKTGSIVKVSAKDIEKQPVTSPLMALQGRVPGLEVTPSSGAPGMAPVIRIRGTNSLRQLKPGNGTTDLEGDGNYPLYVIDGVPISSIPINTQTASLSSGGYDPLSTISPSNIESIEVLKDGDATAIYGSRGANGVILITTKRGAKSEERTNVDVTAYTGVGQVSRQMKLLNTQQYLTMRREGLFNSGLIAGQSGASDAYDLYLWDTTRYTNWQKELLGGSAHIADVQAGVSSGSKNTSFRFNGGYHKESLVFPGEFGYSRLSGQLSVNHTSSNQKFRISLSSTYGLDNNHLFSDDLTYYALTLPPNAPRLRNADGSINWEFHDIAGQKNRPTLINPLANLLQTQDAQTRNSISNINLSYEILPGLVAMTNAGYTDISSNETRKTPLSSQVPGTGVTTGFANFNDVKRTSWIVEPKISYTKQLSRHKLDFLLGGTWQESTNAWRITTGTGYVSDALLGSLTGASKVTTSRDDLNEYRFMSLYTRLGYNWSDKYLLNITGRRDGSSRFGPGNRFGNFGAVGGAWIFSKENLVQRVLPFMNLGKLRASYGITGSDNIGDYNYYNLYRIAENKYGTLTGMTPNAPYNPDYAWEVTKKLEAAIELSFLQNKIGVEIDWYRNRSSNQLVDYPLSDVTGFLSVPTNFQATVENSGWEAIFRSEILSSNDWRWNISFNVSLPSNRLVAFDGIENSPYATKYRVGEPLSISWLYTLKGVNKETGVYEFVDQNGDGLLNGSDRTLQNLAGRIYYGGVTNVIHYRNFEISFLFQFSHRQGARYLAPGTPGTLSNQSVDVLDRWQQTGDETSVQKFSTAIDANGMIPDAVLNYSLLRTSNYSSVDASFIRLKTLSVNWRFPNAWLMKTPLQEARIFLQGQNLVTFTGYQGLDPETGSGLPPLRMITAGVQLKF